MKDNSISLFEIQENIISKKTVEISYYSKYQNEVTDRAVDPIGLSYYLSNWHMIAFCHKRKDYRDFRVDRIESFESTDKSFSDKQHISIKEYFNLNKPEIGLHDISLIINKQFSRFINDSKHWYGFVKQTEYDELNFRM